MLLRNVRVGTVLSEYDAVMFSLSDCLYQNTTKAERCLLGFFSTIST